MPNHPRSHIVMICTGTGSAPMRAMTEWRRRLRQSGKFEGGKLMLFFGARTKEELPYFGPLQNLPKDFIDINFAFSAHPASPSAMCRTLMRERAADLAAAAAGPECLLLRLRPEGMEEGVVLALRDIAENAGLTGTHRRRAEARRAGCTWKPTESKAQTPASGCSGAPTTGSCSMASPWRCRRSRP
jgi:benzoyl-CoA 2,3-dioxygenase component A